MRDCIVPDCAGSAHSHGMCPKHYQRLRRLGSTDTPTRASPADRFWQKVDRASDGCWIWTGACNAAGYGVLHGRERLAHRFSFELHHGAGSADGVLVLHRCDNPPCVRPDHLFPGTNLDNVRDMQAKGRQRPPDMRGERHPSARLTEQQVVEIRAEYIARSRSHGAKPLAARYSVTPAHIEQIVRRKTWSHV